MKTKANGPLRLIAIFKLVKAITLVAVGLGALHVFRNNNAAETVTQLAARVGFNPGARYLDHAIAKIANLPTKDFGELGIGSIVYAALFLTEGMGLWLEKRWGEWFSAIITGSMVPLECVEIYRHFTVTKVLLLLLNIAIVVYLVMKIRNKYNEAD